MLATLVTGVDITFDNQRGFVPKDHLCPAMLGLIDRRNLATVNCECGQTLTITYPEGRPSICAAYIHPQTAICSVRSYLERQR